MRKVILLAGCVAAFVACVGFAQQRNPENKTVGYEAKVFIGQSVDDAKRTMSSRRISFGVDGAFAFSKGDPDLHYMSAVIDQSHTLACIWYSKSKAQVTRLQMVFRPYRQSARADYSWLEASELVLNEDRSYSVKFKPPLTDEETKTLQDNLPPTRFPPNPSSNVK